MINVQDRLKPDIKLKLKEVLIIKRPIFYFLEFFDKIAQFNQKYLNAEFVGIFFP